MPRAKSIPAKAVRQKQYRMVGGPTGTGKEKAIKQAAVKKKRAAAVPRMRMHGIQRTELVEFLMANEDRPTREVVAEFRELCPHNFIEIAHRVEGYKRYTYQTCRRCGLFATNRKAVI